MRKVKHCALNTVITILTFLSSLAGFAQSKTDSAKLVQTAKEFHQALVKANTVSINQQTDKALSYGHSNGWVEIKSELIKNLETKFISYSSYQEDSINVLVNGTMANVRFNASIEASLKGDTKTYHLKVLEVWVRKSNRWVLFARQAVKNPYL